MGYTIQGVSDHWKRPLSCCARGDRAPRSPEPSRHLGWSASLVIHGAVLALALAYISPVDLESTAVPSLARGSHGVLILWGLPRARASPAQSDPGEAAPLANLPLPSPAPAPSPSSLKRSAVAGATAADPSPAPLPPALPRPPAASPTSFGPLPLPATGPEQIPAPLLGEGGVSSGARPGSTVSVAYPERCRRKGHEGSVDVECDVSPDGEVTAVTVVQSSGCEDLDRSAASALAAVRFEPARRGGAPVRSTVVQRITFRLDAAGFSRRAAQ